MELIEIISLLLGFKSIFLFYIKLSQFQRTFCENQEIFKIQFENFIVNDERSLNSISHSAGSVKKELHEFSYDRNVVQTKLNHLLEEFEKIATRTNENKNESLEYVKSIEKSLYDFQLQGNSLLEKVDIVLGNIESIREERFNQIVNMLKELSNKFSGSGR